MFSIKDISADSFFLIAGPCVVENEEITYHTAHTLKNICAQLGIPLIFKSSYKKANRSSVGSFMGIGDEQALLILKKIHDELDLFTITDIHSESEAILAANYVNALQIPAFLSRQTELLLAAGHTQKIVNIKKGQFMNAHAMSLAVQKVSSTGNSNIFLTERGNSFGYHDLVVDFRNIALMKSFGYPVVMDCTHSIQQPNQNSGVTGGTPQFIEIMAKCALVSGADGLFIETHPNPSSALSDGSNMLPLSEMQVLLEQLVKLWKAIK
jgi:2-dehydro-3-deoxyphosphooctonate aldolase (KDO 8-P synthase)